MKKRIFFICVFFIIIIAIFTVSVCIYQHNLNSDTVKNNQIVNINEIEQLISLGRIDEANSKLESLSDFFVNPPLLYITGSILIKKNNF